MFTVQITPENDKDVAKTNQPTRVFLGSNLGTALILLHCGTVLTVKSWLHYVQYRNQTIYVMVLRMKHRIYVTWLQAHSPSRNVK